MGYKIDAFNSMSSVVEISSSTPHERHILAKFDGYGQDVCTVLYVSLEELTCMGDLA